MLFFTGWIPSALIILFFTVSTIRCTQGHVFLFSDLTVELSRRSAARDLGLGLLCSYC